VKSAGVFDAEPGVLNVERDSDDIATTASAPSVEWGIGVVGYGGLWRADIFSTVAENACIAVEGVAVCGVARKGKKTNQLSLCCVKGWGKGNRRKKLEGKWGGGYQVMGLVANLIFAVTTQSLNWFCCSFDCVPTQCAPLQRLYPSLILHERHYY